ncbi:uncharacterized protein LOC131942097 [Physella acuta]|uniref:uncharacterized protein LOC131942097 n=1 Tax=Physella acuta TaxID=109671 RepID=UPI0027DBF51D|nr:uncharacterized protein LOC131942097 [Physella acuta]
MADFDTVDYQNSLHSRQSSASSGHSYSSNKENGTSEHHTSVASEDLSSDASENQLILRDGVELKGESRTDVTQSTFVYENMGLEPTNKDVSPPNSKLGRTLSAGPPGTAKAKVAKSPFSSTPISPIAEEEITIPNDATSPTTPATNSPTSSSA